MGRSSLNVEETHELADEAATLELGAELARRQVRGMIYLQGSLGAGKTTMVRGFLRALGYEGLVKSPTYTLIEPYEVAGLHLLHIDLYRIENAEELVYLGLEELIESSDLQMVEWPLKGEGYLPPPEMDIRIRDCGNGRLARIWIHPQQG